MIISKQPSILLVDDEVGLVFLYKSVIEELGYKVFTAYNSQQALQLAKTIGFKLIITDINIKSVIDGAELIQHVREFLPYVRVIFMSGTPVEQLFQLDLDPTFEYFIEKPFYPEQLLKEISRALDKIIN